MGRVLSLLVRCPSWAVSLLLCASTALAQSQPENTALLSEPIEWTNVADAFDEGDLLDVEVHLGFRRSADTATIEREFVSTETADGRSTRHFVAVARHERTRNELLAELDVGVYHDVMLFLRLPILLGEDQELRSPEGERCGPTSLSAGCQRLRETLPGGSTHFLFDLSSPLKSRTRSGLPSVDLGVAWSITNQYRSPQLPTWVLLLETNFDTGEVMQPCAEGDATDCIPGVSRGTAGVQLESRWSYRYRYLEPFMGVAHRIEWVSGGEALFDPSGPGIVNGDPPSVTSATLGTAFIPWEDRARSQRFEAGLGVRADFVSAGRDVSPLFDALGTSTSPYLTAPNSTSLSPDGRPVFFTGLTNVEAYERLTFDLELVLQAARYVRFSLGASLSYLTPHLITGAPPCDPSVRADRDDPRAGTCSDGIYNPVYRLTIDAPGNRFRVNDVLGVRLQAFAAGTF